MIYRIAFGINGKSVGWRETYAAFSAAENPQDLFGFLADIAAKRAQFLGREFEIVSVRVSRYSTDAGVRAKGVRILKGVWKNSVQTASAAAEPSNVALIAEGVATIGAGNPLFNANTNRVFLGGPLDVSVDNAGVVFPDKGGLGAAYASWAASMVGGDMGWLAAETIANVGITTIAQAANGAVKLTMEAADIAGLVLGQSYKARIRGVNNGHSPLNIELVVRKTLATELTTQRVIGIPTAQTPGSIRIYKQVQPFINFSALNLQGVVGKHKRGRPVGSSPGRVRDRILG